MTELLAPPDSGIRAEPAPDGLRRCFGPMPRRKARPVDRGAGLSVSARAGTIRSATVGCVFRRAIVWFWVGVRFQALVAFDRIRGRRSLADRARRLRQILEEVGGTAIKFGQQLSIRIDVLPYEYCRELSRMLDQVPPFEVDHAIRRIEATTGKPLGETFEALDPRPIGSASIACVYQGVLHGGRRVAVKVRRPNIVERFNADLTAIDWMLTLSETLTFLRPGMVRHLRTELRSMFMEEVDFELEARYQTRYRNVCRRDRLGYLTAPRVHHALSGPDVLVSDLVEGVPLTEVLAATESDDPADRAALEAMGIDPETVGKRLMHVAWWSVFESPLFHADPHPANIIVQPGSKMVFIDFGACGTTSEKTRRDQWFTLQGILHDDPAMTAQVMVNSLAPLPFVDVHALTRRTEAAMRYRIFIIRDKDAPWWERSTAGIWLELLQVTQQYKLPVQLDTIRMARSTLLYDTIVARLWPKMNIEEFRNYKKRYDKRASRRLGREFRKPRAGRAIVERKQRIGRAFDRLTYFVETTLGQMPVNFLSMNCKTSYALGVALRAAMFILVIVVAASWFIGRPGDLPSALQYILAEPFYLALFLPPFLIATRRIAFRLRDIKPRKGRAGLSNG